MRGRRARARQTETIAVALDVSGASRGARVLLGRGRRTGSRAGTSRPCQRDGAGEAQLLQWVQSVLPAMRGETLRLFAREREARVRDRDQLQNHAS